MKRWDLYWSIYNDIDRLAIREVEDKMTDNVGFAGHTLIQENVGVSFWKSYAVIPIRYDLNHFEIASPGFHTPEECYDWWDQNWKSVSSEKTTCDHANCWRCPKRCTEHCTYCANKKLNSRYRIHKFRVVE